MYKKYNEAIISINKILDIIDEIGEDKFRKCLKSYIDNGNDIRITPSKEPIACPITYMNKPNTPQKSILSYQKSMTLK